MPTSNSDSDHEPEALARSASASSRSAADIDARWMSLAIDLAKAGEGAVEPNPMVGCVIVENGERIGQGWHESFGQAHAEVNAIRSVTSANRSRLAQATAYVTLEPCAHQGKTPPCTEALIQAGLKRVVVATIDPNPQVTGQGVQQLQSAGIIVETGCESAAANQLLAPYLKRTKTGRPWVIAKWAMTIDGKLATVSGESQWISNEQSREQVHQLRGRVDAVIAGIGTVLADDPMLNARSQVMPDSPRNAIRVVVDSKARTPLDSKLVRTADQHPVLVATGPLAAPENTLALRAAGCEVFETSSTNSLLMELLDELGRLGATNVLIEGGSGLMGSMNQLHLIDEVQAYVAPILVGGQLAISPIGGDGFSRLQDAARFELVEIAQIATDVMLRYRRRIEQAADA